MIWLNEEKVKWEINSENYNYILGKDEKKQWLYKAHFVISNELFCLLNNWENYFIVFGWE